MDQTHGVSLCLGSGVSAAFAVKLFKSWINERDINSVAASLRKVGMDNRLMVNKQTNILRLLQGLTK